MLNQDWEKFCEDTLKTVQNAVDNRDYFSLNQTISDTINKTVSKTVEGARNLGSLTSDSLKFHKPQVQPMLFKKVNGWKPAAIVIMVIGIIIAVSMFPILVGTIFAMDFSSGLETAASLILFLTIGIVFAIGVICAVAGKKISGRVKRFDIYKKELGMQEYFEIGKAAQELGKSKKFVIRDLKKLIQKKWFIEGHLDNQNTCFIASDDMFRQYNELMNRVEQQKADEKAKNDARLKKQDGLPLEVREVIQAGDAYIRKIRECNDRIPGEEISNKISRIELLVDKIFNRVEEDPQCIGDIRKLMDYYLPTTVKLLDAYAELDEMSVQGENIISSKAEIEKTLDTLNVAFEKLLDSLFQEKVWDVSADISVLNTMLAQEGLTKDDF